MNPTEYPVAVEIKNSEDLNIDFQQYWFAIKRRWLPAIVIAGGFFALGFMGIMRISKHHYVAEGKILVKPDESASLTGLLEDTKNQLTPLTFQGNPLKTEIEIILSKPVISRVINSLNLLDEDGKTLSEKSLKQNIEVEDVGGTDILQISYKSKDSKVAASVVNGIMKAYIENNKLVNRSEALAAKKFIAQQLPETQESVRQAENLLRNFQEKNQLVAIDEEAKLSLETVERLKTQIAETKANFANVNARYRDLIDKLGMDYRKAIVVAKLSQSQPVQATLTEIQKTEEQLKIENTFFQDENPKILNLKDKLNSLKNQLQERIRQEIGDAQTISAQDLQAGELETGLISQLINLQIEQVGLSNQIASLENNLSKYQERINTLPKLKEEEREIQRNLEAAQATYETLLTKLKEIEAAGNQNVANARIIEEASEPKNASSDKSTSIFLLGNVVVSLIMFIGTIILLEKADRSLKNVKSVEKVFQYSLLATIPTFKSKQNIIYKNLDKSHIEIPVRDNPFSPISEAFRMLQASLEFIDDNKTPNVIVISSSISEEGKSTVAANLAAVYAELKEKVLLIDANMRTASQHNAWGLTNEIGLSNVIVGRTDISTAIKEIMPNLHILTSGVMPANPVTLLKSQAMASLIKNASRNYDYVIIDAPAVLIGADALILGKMSDGILMVSRPGVVDSNYAVNAKNLLKKSGQNVLGLVVNSVILKNESDNYFHFTENHAPEKALFIKNKSVEQISNSSFKQ